MNNHIEYLIFELNYFSSSFMMFFIHASISLIYTISSCQMLMLLCLIFNHRLNALNQEKCKTINKSKPHPITNKVISLITFGSPLLRFLLLVITVCEPCCTQYRYFQEKRNLVSFKIPNKKPQSQG